MPYFIVVMEGRGIFVAANPSDSSDVYQKPPTGFFTTKAVFARDQEDASVKARAIVTELWSAPPYSTTNTGSLPTLTVESIHGISWLRGLLGGQRYGHTFFSEDQSSA